MQAHITLKLLAAAVLVEAALEDHRELLELQILAEAAVEQYRQTVRTLR